MGNSQNTQGQNASDTGNKVDISEYASKIDSENPDKVKSFLQNAYSDEELADVLANSNSIVTKSVKKAYNADVSRSTKQSELDKLINLANQSGSTPSAPSAPAETGSEETELSPADQDKIAKLVDSIENIDGLNTRLGTIEKMLKTAEGRSQSIESMQYSQESRIRTKRLQEGFEWLKETLGEENAINLYDPNNPKDTAIGMLLQPELIDDSNPQGKELKEKIGRMSIVAYGYDNPVLGALRLLGDGEVMSKAFNKQAPETESAGKSTLGKPKTEKDISDHFFGDVLGVEEE